MSSIDDLITNLTTHEAISWSVAVERWSYVTDQILGPNGFHSTRENVARVEDRLRNILRRSIDNRKQQV